MSSKPDEASEAGELRGRAEARLRAKAARRSETAPEDPAALLHELQVHQIELEMQNEELRRAKEALETSRARYYDLYDLAPVGYLTLDDRGVILEANLRASELLGVARAGLVARPMTEFVLRGDQDVWYLHFQRLSETGGPLTWEMQLAHSDREPLWVRLEAVVDVDLSTGAHGCRLVMTDVTERKGVDAALNETRGLLERRVAERTADLQAACGELETLVYTIAHDLPAPLRAVNGYAGILEKEYGDRLDDEGRRLLGVVRAAALGMDRLINDLLDYSHAGSVELRRGRVDMTALARESYEQAGSEETRRGFRFTVGELPPAWGDAALLRHVWSNLIDNAIKYSQPRPEKVIEIGGSDEGGMTTYWVRDHGVGFEPDHGHKLFGVFQRLHAAEDIAGTGIGLAIVRRIVARHGGTTRAEGAPNAGATFTFSLPDR